MDTVVTRVFRYLKAEAASGRHGRDHEFTSHELSGRLGESIGATAAALYTLWLEDFVGRSDRRYKAHNKRGGCYRYWALRRAATSERDNQERERPARGEASTGHTPATRQVPVTIEEGAGSCESLAGALDLPFQPHGEATYDPRGALPARTSCELDVMAGIVTALEGLDHDARVRVLTYLVDRYGGE